MCKKMRWCEDLRIYEIVQVLTTVICSSASVAKNSPS